MGKRGTRAGKSKSGNALGKSAGEASKRHEEAGVDKAEEGPVTVEEAEALIERAKQGDSLRAARLLLRAFRGACHSGEAASGEACNTVLRGALQVADGMFRSLMRSEKVRADKPPQRWKKVEPLARSFFGNAVGLLREVGEGKAKAFVLARIAQSADILSLSDKSAKLVVKEALSVWGQGEPEARVQAIVTLRRLALHASATVLDEVLKGSYKEFAASCAKVTRHSAEHVAFMTACLVELYGLDHEAAYAHAFSGVRGLAQCLRRALAERSQEALRAVYTWRFVCCLEAWERVVSVNAGDNDESPLRHLIYPLSQVAFGALRLLPSSRYAPLRLRVLRAIERLGRNTGKYMPVARHAADLLLFNEMAKKPLPSRNQREADLSAALKVPKSELRATYFQEFVLNRALSIIADHFEQWSYHPSFPELAHIPLKRLRSFVKMAHFSRFKKKAQALVSSAESTSEWVGRRRDQVDFAPKDARALASFLHSEKARQEAPIHKQASSIRDHVRQQELAMTASEVTVSGSAPGGDDVTAKGGEVDLTITAKDEAKRRGEEMPEEGRVEELVLSDEDEEEEEGQQGDELGGAKEEEEEEEAPSDVDEDEKVLGIPSPASDDGEEGEGLEYESPPDEENEDDKPKGKGGKKSGKRKHSPSSAGEAGARPTTAKKQKRRG